MSNCVVFFGNEVTREDNMSFGRYEQLVHWLLNNPKLEQPILYLIDLPNYRSEQKLRRAYPNHRLVLIRVEPPTVNPRQYSARVQKRFSLVVGGHALIKEPILKWKTGYEIPKFSAPTANSQSYTDFTFVAARKFSVVSNEQYSTRDAVLRALQRAGLTTTIVGAGWDRPRWKPVAAAILRTPLRSINPAKLLMNTVAWFFLSPRGPHLRFVGQVDAVQDYLASCRATLVMENETTYSSEKLVNAIQASRRIVYFGKSRPLGEMHADCFRSYSEPRQLLRDIHSGAIASFLSAPLGCQLSSHPEVRQLFDEVDMQLSTSNLRGILERHLTLAS
ncbi:hypothetical protein N9M34_00545 [Aquiluna sp.]|nr:hypothetical protein [Aquiluna sp.]